MNWYLLLLVLNKHSLLDFTQKNFTFTAIWIIFEFGKPVRMIRKTRGFKIANCIRKKTFLILLFPLITCMAFGQETNDFQPKSIHAGVLPATPIIDGIPDRDIWNALPLATDFVQYDPYNGQSPTYETEIRFGYDETGLYVGAFLYDDHPDSIFTEIGRRDQVDELNTDYLSVDILPYNDGLTMFEFKITPTGLQSDNKYSATGKESSWDAVWQSAASITDSGWVAEFFIPYSALRFPKTDVQTWGINMWRRFARHSEMSTWTWVPNDQGEIFTFYGTLVGMENIKPPIRLSLTPYLGGYLEKQPGEAQWNSFVRGGMDLKYGISQAFTLDMELVPDFGQVQSDDIVLNLSPYEIRYEDQRQFFTEGTELFEKCDIFYSRRVGAEPKGFESVYDSLKANEKVSKNPDITQVINATKVSGRNRNGLGIGVFNGITTNTWAEVKDTLNGDTRRIATQPFTNYNVLVFDQNLKNRSYITLINTNYWTPKWDYMANVTGTETKLLNHDNTFGFKGMLNVSQIMDGTGSADLGYTTFLNIYRPGGTWRYSLSTTILDNNYDPNDMGFLQRNNEVCNYGALSYNITYPVWRILRSRTQFEAKHYALYKPFELMFVDVEINNTTTFRNFWQYYAEIAYRPTGNYDYYEPRVDGWYFYQPPSWDGELGVSTDSKKRLAAELQWGFFVYNEADRQQYWFAFEPRYRVSDRLTFSWATDLSMQNNDYGWVETEYDAQQNPTIYFGRRDVLAIDNVFSTRYIFTTDLSLNLRARHYWSRVDYFDYYTLQPDGNLLPSDFTQNNDIDFNAFNLDLQFLWFFAPGSQMSLVWKNNILTLGDTPSGNYFDAFRNTIDSPQTNSLSLRILYYLDYTDIKKTLSGNKKVK
ncbi:MAG: carbohydrate binding family 9 domain-containing protein [Bacteroidales bacterium]|nr:carbohydrate binding family 9 domain-containing protein [Bacteroidales bacterium]